MELFFVGTSSGRTSINRFHSSILIQDNNKNVLIDSGDGISKALLKLGIPFNSITDIVFSHYHSDHLAGLPSLLTQMIIQKRSEPLNIYTHNLLINQLKAFLQSSFIFLEKLPFEVIICEFNFGVELKISNDIRFTAQQNSHVKNKHGLDIDEFYFISSSFLFLLNNKSILYTSDIGNENDLYLFQNNEVDILITETTHIPLHKIINAAQCLSVNTIYLTHIDDELSINQWYNELQKKTKEKFVLASDGMSLKL